MAEQINDLRKHLFNQLDRLSDPNNNLEQEVKRAEALTSVGRVIVDSAKAEIDFMKVTGNRSSNFIPGDEANHQIEGSKVKAIGNGSGKHK